MEEGGREKERKKKEKQIRRRKGRENSNVRGDREEEGKV